MLLFFPVHKAREKTQDPFRRGLQFIFCKIQTLSLETFRKALKSRADGSEFSNHGLAVLKL